MSQSQPYFAEMILGWSPSKIVSDISYVKLSSAVAAILVGGLKCRTKFWKGTTQGSFQQSLVEIGSVVSEEKISLKFHLPFFIFSAIGWFSSKNIAGGSAPRRRRPPQPHLT
jgi:hypothetical protein